MDFIITITKITFKEVIIIIRIKMDFIIITKITFKELIIIIRAIRNFIIELVQNYYYLNN